MNLALLSNLAMRFNLRTRLNQWLGHAIPALAPVPRAASDTKSANAPHAGATPLPVAAQPSTATTPIKWFSALPPDRLPVLFIDTASGQLSKIIAMPRRQVAQYLRTPIYTDHTTRWTSLGTELRREGFTVATAFQAQEDALLAMEALESARWHATSQLAHLDNEIRQAFVALIEPLLAHGDNATPATPRLGKAPLANFAQMLDCRATMSDELARIDEEAIPTLQRLGMALPDEMVNAFTATRSQAHQTHQTHDTHLVPQAKRAADGFSE